MGVVPSAASTINILLLLLAVFWACPAWKELSTKEKILCYLMLTFFLAATVSFVNSEDLPKSWSRLERLLRVLAFIPIYMLLKKLDLDLTKPLTYGFLAAGPVLFIVGTLGSEGGRASGAYNPILFGDFAAFVAALLFAVLVFKQTSLKFKVFSTVSLLCAIQAMILSGTRGAWLGLGVSTLAIVLIFLFHGGYLIQRFQTRILAVFLAVILITPVILTNQSVPSRTIGAFEEFRSYVSGGNSSTSVGLRLQMWEAGIKMWQKHPLIGSGLGDYSTDLAKMIASGESKMTDHFGEGHSLFFEFLGTTGTLGFMTCLFSLFLYPLWLTKSILKQQTDLFIPVATVVTILSFAAFGISQNWLGRSSITSVYLVFLAIFIYSVSRRSAGTNQKV